MKAQRKTQRKAKGSEENTTEPVESSANETTIKPTAQKSLASDLFGGSDTAASITTASNLFSAVKPVAEKLVSRVVVPEKKRNKQEAKKGPGKKGKEDKSDSEGDDDEEEGPQTSNKERSNPEATVFVGNLPPTTTKRSLRRIFRSCGDIHSVRLRDFVKSPFNRKTNSRDATTVESHAAGSVYGYVCFKDVACVEGALELDGRDVGEGFFIRVDRIGEKSNSQFTSDSSVFIGNVPRTATEKELATFFSGNGLSVNHVRLVRDPESGIGKGFGFVSFKSADDIAAAINLGGSDFGGRPIRVMKTSQQGKGQQRKDKRSRSDSAPPRNNQSKGRVGGNDSGNQQWQGYQAKKVASIDALPKKVKQLMKIK